MRLTKFGHSCLLVEEGGASVLLDPGMLSGGFEELAVPAGAPWLKISESIDYLREVRPGVAVPVHEKVLSTIGVSLHYRQLEELGTGGGTTLHVLDDGKPVE